MDDPARGRPLMPTGTRVTRDFASAEERARLAAADLLAAANDVIRARTLSWNDARDEVDAALLSRRWTGYAPSGRRKLDEADDDLAFARRAHAEIASISASARASAAAPGAEAAVADPTPIGRLLAIADECERRAIRLRS
jgi:hypothetical protein